MTDHLIQPRLIQVDELFQGSVLEAIQEEVASPLLNWGYYPPSMARDIRRYDWYQHTHMVYDSDHALSDLFPICKLILAQALDRTDRKLDQLFKVRVVNGLPGTAERSLPHIDLVGPHQTGIFFPTESDGTTDIMYERSWLESWELPETYNVAHSLEAKANTWYEVDGTHWRKTGLPSKFDQRYCVIFNFVASPK